MRFFLIYFLFLHKLIIMTFSEALRGKKKFITNSSNFMQTIYHCLIIPSIEEEAQKYITDFKNSPSSFIDESCKLYSSDADFKLWVIPIKDFKHSHEKVMVKISE